MGKNKNSRAKESIQKSVSPQSSACAKEDRFVRNQLFLCELQDKLELSLFLFCRNLCPEILARRKWNCYQAAELPALTEEILRYCQDHKPAIASTGITPEERDDFLLDLHASRVIRNAAVHRDPVHEITLQRLGDCASRVISMVERMTGSSYHSELQEIQQWMATQGWPTNDLSSTSALLLCKRIDSGSEQLAQSMRMKAAKKELNQRRNEEQWKAAIERRQQRQAMQEDCQVASQIKRDERQQRSREQREEAENKREERRRRAQAQESAQARKLARRKIHCITYRAPQARQNNSEAQQSAEELAIAQSTHSDSSPIFAIWNWMC